MDRILDLYGDEFLPAPARVPYFDPVRDRFDDSLFLDASVDRLLMEPRWEGDQYLMQSPMFSDPGDPMGTRARRRRRELEDEILPDIGAIDMRALGPPPDEHDVRQIARMHTRGRLDTGMIDAMVGADLRTPYATGIRDADFEFLGPPPVSGLRLGATYDERFRPREDEAEFYMRSRDRRPRRRRSLSITSGVALPPGATPDPRMPRDVRLEDHLMGAPEANMLLGARPFSDRGGTPIPDIGLREPMLGPRRERRW
jgi:hypothetical protein